VIQSAAAAVVAAETSATVNDRSDDFHSVQYPTVSVSL